MRSRWGLGPVFVYEWLTASRRWQMYALRALFVGLLFLAIVIMWFKEAEPLLGSRKLDPNAHARVGVALFYAFFGALLSVTLLLAPAATAGAVCLDKTRGTLLHLLVTDLSAREIVCGKLAVRLIPLFGLVLASVPVLSLCLWLGGIDPDAMFVAYAVTVGVAVLGSSLAFLLSVWGRKTHEVLLATYLFEILLLLAYAIAIGLDGLAKQTWLSPYVAWTNPYRLAFSPYMFRGATDPAELTTFLSFCLGVGIVCATLAVLTIRSVTVRQASQPQRCRRKLLPWIRRPWWLAPRLDHNPVYWREWHRQRPSRWARITWAVYVIMAVAATIAVAFNRETAGIAAFVSGLQVSVGLLLASVAAVTSLSEERVRGSLDVLLATPLPTRSIVWGKWRGAFRIVPWLALLPVINIALVASPAAFPLRIFPPGVAATGAAAVTHPGLIWLSAPLMFGLVLCYGAAVTSLGLACATWSRRQGRAIAASVVIYALVAAGWLALLAAIGSHDQATERLMIASPFFGPGELAFESGNSYQRTADGLPRCFGAVVAWAVVFAVVAAVFYLAVLGTFNRCLGRMAEQSWRPQRKPRGSSPLARLPKHILPPLVIEVAAEDEQQIRQPIQVDKHLRTDGFAAHE